jgi:hypothetical protein
MRLRVWGRAVLGGGKNVVPAGDGAEWGGRGRAVSGGMGVGGGVGARMRGRASGELRISIRVMGVLMEVLRIGGLLLHCRVHCCPAESQRPISEEYALRS